MRILNFGSLNLDSFYSVDHFVQAGETLSSEKLEKFCGGKGLNQSIALAKAGAQVYHAGCVGQDGECLRGLLEESGVHTQYVRTVEEVSGHAIIQVDSRGQNCILLYGGANHQVTVEMIDQVMEDFGEGDLLLLQNETNLVGEIVNRAFQRGMQIALNPSPVNSRLQEIDMEKVSCFLLNEVEGKALTGKIESGDILDDLRTRYPSSTVVLTLGKEGVVYDDGALRCSHGIYDVPVVDTTGAGDTFTGFFLASRAAGKTPQECLRLASVASSIVVSRKGAGPSIPSLEEVDAAKLPLKG